MLVHHAIQQSLESCFIALFVAGVKNRGEILEICFIGSGLVVNDTGSLRDTVYPVDISFHVDYHGAFQGEERDGHAVGLFHGNDLERT